MTEAEELEAEGEELLVLARRYLSEFGTVDPETLSRRIDSWRNRRAVFLTRERADP